MQRKPIHNPIISRCKAIETLQILTEIKVVYTFRKVCNRNILKFKTFCLNHMNCWGFSLTPCRVALTESALLGPQLLFWRPVPPGEGNLLSTDFSEPFLQQLFSTLHNESPHAETLTLLSPGRGVSDSRCSRCSRDAAVWAPWVHSSSSACEVTAVSGTGGHLSSFQIPKLHSYLFFSSPDLMFLKLPVCKF